ncbi:hypothetical protein K458DRAFT_425346 [Lentithecium fluviatile CBS 122367]|uniref:Uncharacterized protein n=1 Tax=Lentithecium fluviatile CBS 122367 TaxID=1168545 RepID=A0A6G1IBY7_9PLEO|nr:hypothetical protein K458DRAFT_425346 [Lentithecium fluviatile CBS 122367]
MQFLPTGSIRQPEVGSSNDQGIGELMGSRREEISIHWVREGNSTCHGFIHPAEVIYEHCPLRTGWVLDT